VEDFTLVKGMLEPLKNVKLTESHVSVRLPLLLPPSHPSDPCHISADNLLASLAYISRPSSPSSRPSSISPPCSSPPLEARSSTPNKPTNSLFSHPTSLPSSDLYLRSSPTQASRQTSSCPTSSPSSCGSAVCSPSVRT
jgi:hypothetical protein